LILELIEGIVAMGVGASAYGLGHWLLTQKGTLNNNSIKLNLKKDSYGAYPWLWHTQSMNPSGYYCPACASVSSNRKQMPACQCDEYPSIHFHFVCNDCGYKCFTRTAEDN